MTAIHRTGQYINALTLYATITGLSPVGLDSSDVQGVDAGALQQLVWDEYLITRIRDTDPMVSDGGWTEARAAGKSKSELTGLGLGRGLKPCNCEECVRFADPNGT